MKTLINQSSEEAKVGMGESADSAQLRSLFFFKLPAPFFFLTVNRRMVMSDWFQNYRYFI